MYTTNREASTTSTAKQHAADGQVRYTGEDMFTGLSGSEIIAVLVSIVVAMGVHEAMHAYVAHALGDTTAQDEGRLTLNPLAHIDALTTVLLPMVLILLGQPPIFAAKPVPLDTRNIKWDEYGVALVGLAGPFTNLAMAGITAIGIRLFSDLLGPMTISVLGLFLVINVGFFVFNMIPFPPLDGSRLLYAFAPDWLRDIMERIEALGFMAFLIVLLLAFQFIAPLLSDWNSTIVNFLIS